MPRTHRLPLLAAVLVLALAGGCSKPRPADAPAPATGLRSQALIDSGNAAFRAKDFDTAARRYASAIAAQPDDPAAHYGLGMALSRLGRDDEARAAYAKARALIARGGGDTTTAPH